MQRYTPPWGRVVGSGLVGVGAAGGLVGVVRCFSGGSHAGRVGGAGIGGGVGCDIERVALGLSPRRLFRLQVETLHLSPVMMGATNGAGGVRGKRMDIPSIVVAGVATAGRPDSPDVGTVWRALFLHAVGLALLVAVVVWVQARWFPGVIPGSAVAADRHGPEEQRRSQGEPAAGVSSVVRPRGLLRIGIRRSTAARSGRWWPERCGRTGPRRNGG